jgi:hypothetical protein
MKSQASLPEPGASMSGPDQHAKSDDAVLDLQSTGDEDPIQSQVEVSNACSSKSKRQSSDVFDFVKPLPNGDGWKCSVCASMNKVHIWKTRSTSNFRKHLNSDHHDIYARKDPAQTRLTHHGFSATGKKRKYDDLTLFNAADKKETDRRLTRFVVNHSQPFSLVESKDFIEFCASLREEYDVPSRKTLRSRIVDMWSEQKKLTAQYLTDICLRRRVGTTTDMWTSAAKRGYMVITLHVIDEE